MTPIAIVGMAAIMPEATSLREYWSNIVAGRDCITDVPPSRWSIEDYYDPDPAAPDKTYCKRGGFIPDVLFDPVEFGLPPNILEVTDVHQLLALVLARRALEDAGYGESGRAFDRERTGVILGIGGGQKLVTPLTSRLQYPVWKRALVSSGVSEADADRVVEKIKLAYVPWEENSFPGMLGNVIAGRVANRLDLGGINCVVDAACASSLSALKMALSELTERRCDVMITGGLDTDNSIFMYMSFSKTPAFTPGEKLRPFDAESDGMLVGEGLGMLVLKRLEDAERDGDRIYATVKGIGTASDGRFKSIYAPRSEGQARALRRAYENAGVAPATVGLIEAHGTGTVAGDMVEATTLVEVLGEDNPRRASIALGSVKSQIGHTKSAAGAAGLIKAALALHHKVLPPTINVSRPHPEFGLEDSPVYVNTRTRPWAAGQTPRRAGVSSFGFGGTNYHVVLEEHTRAPHGEYRLHPVAQPLILAAPDRQSLLERGRALLAALDGEETAEAAQREASDEWSAKPIPHGHARLGFVANGVGEARSLLAIAVEQIAGRDAMGWDHPKGIWYRAEGTALEGKVAALFPGQGSQYVEMGRELACNSPEVGESFEALDALFERDGRPALSEAVYPAPAFDDGTRAAQSAALQRTEYAQPAIGALSAALFRVLAHASFRPDVVAGHSFGELTALWAAGALDDDTFYELARARGAAMAPPAGEATFDAGTMLSVAAKAARVEAVLAGAGSAVAGVTIANVNSPRQVVVAGPRAAVEAAERACEANGLKTTALPVSAAFHTPLVAHAQAAFGAAVAKAEIRAPRMPVYANATGETHAAEPEAIRTALVSHLMQPVQFQREVERLYEAGVRVFVEVGPRSVLTNLVGEILGDRPHTAVAVNASRQKDSDRQLREALVRLKVLGLRLDITDRHAAPTTERAARKASGAAVWLTGANYVSEKRRAAYASALSDGHRIGETPTPAQPTVPVEAQPVAPTQPQALVQTQTQHDTPTQPQTLTETLTVIESGLTAFGQQQSDSLRAHQQYLAAQAEQSRVFLQLVQQQQELLLSPQAAGVPREAHETLARSLALYQELQVETARAHQAYLQQHTEHARLFADVLRGQGRGGMVPERVAVPALPAPASRVAPVLPVTRVAAPAAPVATTPPAPVVMAPPPIPVAAPPVATPPPPVAPVAPVAQAAPVAPAQPAHVAEVTVAGVTSALLECVSEKTGYPVETLELEMDIEADLGIDSIKRVEILGAMRSRFPSAPVLKPAEMAELRTLQQIVSYLEAQDPVGQPSAAVGGASSVAAAPAPATSAVVEPAPWTTIRLKHLPPADRLETAPPPGTTCLVTDDGSALTPATVGLLARAGWRVAVLRLPGVAATAEGVPGAVATVVAADSSEGELIAALERVTAAAGPVGALVHLSPTSGGPALFGEAERASVRHAFLLAKLLKPALSTAAAGGQGRAAFLAVTRLDGSLGSGLNGSAAAFTAESGGLYGLVKTLRLEWPDVHCRAIDASPDLTTEQVASHILAEYLDPDGLVVEVGHSAAGRVTLAPAAPVGGAR